MQLIIVAMLVIAGNTSAFRDEGTARPPTRSAITAPTSRAQAIHTSATGRWAARSDNQSLQNGDVVGAWLTPAPLRVQSREELIKTVAQIQRADYEGDREALQRLYRDLSNVPTDRKLASRVLYWRGFALWRRAMNGFNESVPPADVEADLTQAANEFGQAVQMDPQFVDAKIGALSCLSNLIFLNQRDPDRVQKLVARAQPLRKDAEAAEPDNPRLLWVLGPICWYAPGGSCGQDRATEMAKRGLESARRHKEAVSDPLEPSWGEPELLAALAWINLHQTTPDLVAAEQFARAALEIVPYWHYVRDILLPQIRRFGAQFRASAALRERHPCHQWRWLTL
jgi:hypothetical protein